MQGQISIKTKLGWISAFEKEGKIFKIKFGKLRKQHSKKILKNFRNKLNSFLKKKTLIIKIPHIIEGNRIQKKIWNELKKIKYGKTKSYIDVGKKYKLSPRYIGKICGQNKLLLVVPCHRVIRNDGNLGGFSSTGGTKLKKKILDFEKENL